MSIIELKERGSIIQKEKLNRIYIQFRELLEELRKRELPAAIIKSINQDIEELNLTSLTGERLGKVAKQKQRKIIKLLEKELKIVPKNHYRNLWLVLGLCVFGIPIGVVYGHITHHNGMMGIGLPIGMGIGICLGFWLDKKATKEGRQLNVEIKY